MGADLKLVEVVSDEINESTNTDYYARWVGISRNVVRSNGCSSEGLSLQNPPLGLSTFQTQILSQITPQVLPLLPVRLFLSQTFSKPNTFLVFEKLTNTLIRLFAQRAEKRQGRGTAWVFIEMLCAFLAVALVNMKLADGRAKRERLAHQNDAFKHQVQSKWDDQQWVGQDVITEDKDS